MSRVYEALRKAERQRIAEDALENRSTAPVAAVPPHEALPRNENAAEANEAWRQAHAPLIPATGPLEGDRLLRPPSLRTARQERPAPSRGDDGPLLVMDREQYATAAEQFHLFAARLQNWAAANEKRVFMITSSLSGEGKSFVALNLAVTLAQIGNRVLLVDADLRGPTLHRAFNLAPLHGLIDYLDGGIDLRACLQATPVPGLLLVAAGGRSHTPTEALARPRMRQLITEARSLVPPHYVIVDAPAASAVPESQMLFRLMDALVFVVAANRTPRELVKQTIEKARDTTIFGLALNRFEAPYSAAVRYPERYTGRSGHGREDKIE